MKIQIVLCQICYFVAGNMIIKKNFVIKWDSILYKMRLPMIVVFNKCDVSKPEKVAGWLKDYDNFMVIIVI